MTFTIIFLSSLLCLEESFLTAQKFFFSSHAHQTTTTHLDREKKEKTTEKRITSDGFVCRSSRRRRRQGYENLYTGFLLTFLPSFVFLRVTRFTDVLSLSFFYFRTHRREDFQDEVRAVPRRRTGGRTQTGTRVCFRRHLFSDRLWSV